MANLTIVIDEAVLKQARLRALEEGTSVNALVRDYLVDYARLRQRQVAAIDRVLEIAAESRAGGEAAGRSWRRDDAHDRGRW